MLADSWEMNQIKDVCQLGRGRVINQNELYAHPGQYPVYSSQSKDGGSFGYLDTFDFEGEYVTWTTDGAYAGTVFYRSGRFNCTNVCGTLKAKTSQICMKYLAYALSTKTKKHVSYVGNPKLMNNVMGDIVIAFPSPHEQRHIAEILDTIDEAIQKTEALISKLKAMKQGLLHDLLTRGLDENGKVRDPKAHPEQFKDSPLGRIPKKWNIMPFVEVLAGVVDFRGKTPLKIAMRWGGGNIPALSANNVEMGQINLTKETYYGSPGLYARWMTSGDPAKGDVLMTLEAPLGNVAQIPDDQRYILSQRVVLFKTKDELMLNTFFRYQLMSEPFQRALARDSTGTTATGIQRAKLEKLPVLVPPRHNEQELIASRIEAIDSRISTEEQYRDKLKLQKKGLMHDLLTGKRVKVNDNVARC